MSVVFKMGLQSLENALKGRLPLKGESIKVDSSTFLFKEYRKQAKTVLSGLVNCISNVVPEFSLKDTAPKSPLLPCGVGWNRVKCLPEELSLREVDHPTAYFRHCPESGKAIMDFLDPTEMMVRMCFSADEGTEVCELPHKKLSLTIMMHLKIEYTMVSA